jgi:hypothetical protein
MRNWLKVLLPLALGALVGPPALAGDWDGCDLTCIHIEVLQESCEDDRGRNDDLCRDLDDLEDLCDDDECGEVCNEVDDLDDDCRDTGDDDDLTCEQLFWLDAACGDEGNGWWGGDDWHHDGCDDDDWHHDGWDHHGCDDDDWRDDR